MQLKPGAEVYVTRRVQSARRVFSHTSTDKLGRSFPVYRQETSDKVIEEKGIIHLVGPLFIYVKLEGRSGLYAADPSQVSTNTVFVEVPAKGNDTKSESEAAR